MTRKLISRNVQQEAPSKPFPPSPSRQEPLAIDEVKPLPLGALDHSDNAPRRPRLHFLANLRIFLTTLVILHHTAVAYGGLGSWPFKSGCFPAVSPVLAIFNAMNQTFFMALFMWMAGFFTHRELTKLAETERRMRKVTTWDKFGVRLGFTVDRAKRLILPTVFYTLIIQPVIVVMVKLHLNDQGWSRQVNPSSKLIAAVLADYFSNLRGIRGPVWFSAVVFIFDIIATITFPFLPALRTRFPAFTGRLRPEISPPLYQLRLIYLTISILATFLIRIPYPIGSKLSLLNLQLAFLPQYIFAYTAGHTSASTGNLYIYSYAPDIKHHPFRRLVRNTLKMLFALLIIALVAALQAFSSSSSSSSSCSKFGFRRANWQEKAIQDLEGGWNKSALLYAVFNEVCFVSIGPSLVAVFEKYFNFAWTPSWPMVGRGKDMARYCYAVFLVHAIVSVGVEVLLESWVGQSCVVARRLGAVGMTAVVGAVNVCCSWMLAVLLCEKTWVGRWL